MSPTLILASGSAIRAQLLSNAGLTFRQTSPDVDEAMIKSELLRDSATPDQIASRLAQAKASAVSDVSGYVLGSDQVLEVDGELFSKPTTPAEAVAQLSQMRAARQHRLHTAAAIVRGGTLVWSYVDQVTLTLRPFSDAYLEGYVARNWEEIRYCVGAYKLEEEGARLFEAINGDYFHVLGLPLLEIIGFLISEGVIEG
ncbi:MAG: Maf-like protein [Rhodobacteraceae bacterium]|nr:Maf-like protein [Paracoccaceae bacterium]